MGQTLIEKIVYEELEKSDTCTSKEIHKKVKDKISYAAVNHSMERLVKWRILIRERNPNERHGWRYKLYETDDINS